MATQVETDLIYSPSSLVGIFANTLNNETTRKLVQIKGVYVEGKGVSYGGYFYDSLKDENSDASITLVIPVPIRTTLTTNKTIECSGFISKRVQAVGARVDLLFNVTELTSQKEATFSTDQLKGFELLQRKAEIGHKDVDSFIRSSIVNEEPLTVNILIGKNAIIDGDIKHQLQEGIGFYKFHFIRINLSSDREIIEGLNFYSKKCDILVVARGGGVHMEVFNKPEIAECALSLKTYFVTAIGHEGDVSLLQKVADKAFITPTSLGEYFRTIYNSTIEQLQNSRAKITNDIKHQLEANYGQQIQHLNEKLLSEQQLKDKELALVNEHLQRVKVEKAERDKQVKELEVKAAQARIPGYVWVLLIVAVIVGWVIGRVI